MDPDQQDPTPVRVFRADDVTIVERDGKTTIVRRDEPHPLPQVEPERRD